MEDKYQNVIVIGNGFDLNLGLPTFYTDFVSSPKFRDNLDIPLFRYLNKQQQIKKWIDLEVELKNYANAISSPIGLDLRMLNSESDMSNYRQFQCLCGYLKSYLKGIDYNKIDQNSYAAKYLRERAGKGALILNFNYTNTVPRVLGDQYKYVNEQKIHGSCDQEIILGVEDNANIPKEFTFLKKSTSLIYNNIDYDNILKNADSIIFFGYSLGETDHSYFDTFFFDASHAKMRNKIEFNYYQESGLLDLNQELDTLTKHLLGAFKRNADPKFIDVDKIK